MNLIEKALIFATHAHEGQTRKASPIPYILHPAEVAAIIATMTTDENVIAAGLLHDVVEDCNVDALEIRREFGPRVYALVQSETEDKLSDRPPEETWMERKEESLLALEHTKDTDVKILWLGDKLSNIRSFYRLHVKEGDKMWSVFHQKDPAMHAWYYRSIAKALAKELGDTPAYQEYISLVEKIFGKEENV